MLYLQPQYRTNSGEILNVVSSTGKMLGYLLYMYKENDDLYVLGHLDDQGERQNFEDVISHFVVGLKKICGAKEDPFVRIYCGGEPIEFNQEKSE